MAMQSANVILPSNFRHRHPSLPLRRHSLQASTAATATFSPEKVEVFKSLEGWATNHILPLLKPVGKCWQPHDFLPDPSQPSDVFFEEVRALRERAAELPDEFLVVLVGDMITEDALPTYETFLNTLHEVSDETCADPDPWATWTRAWTAEEKRHGDLLRTYLYLSGRVDMLMVERTVQHLIGAGMNVGQDKTAYMGLVYTSFQERATAISHGNTARLALAGGDPTLARVCGTIAADEKRHGEAYQRVVEKLLEVDPTGAVLAIAAMMRRRVTMPAMFMHDGYDPRLFDHFGAVAQRLGVYTAADYADILDYLVRRWRLEKLEGLTAEGREAQDFLCGLPQRIRVFQEKVEERAKKVKKQSTCEFSWIFNRTVRL